MVKNFVSLIFSTLFALSANSAFAQTLTSNAATSAAVSLDEAQRLFGEGNLVIKFLQNPTGGNGVCSFNLTDEGGLKKYQYNCGRISHMGTWYLAENIDSKEAQFCRKGDTEVRYPLACVTIGKVDGSYVIFFGSYVPKITIAKK